MTTPEPPDATREAFEAWARDANLGLHIERSKVHDGYIGDVPDTAWIAFRAARATLAERDAEIARLREALTEISMGRTPEHLRRRAVEALNGR